MEPVIEWEQKFSVGIEEIDEQHKKLFEIINDVFDGIAVGSDSSVLNHAFEQVIDYTKYHFATEERYLDQMHYPDAAEHKAQHQKLLEETLKLQEEFTEGAPSVSLELVDFLTEWLQKHILLHDKKYAPFIQDKIESEALPNTYAF